MRTIERIHDHPNAVLLVHSMGADKTLDIPNARAQINISASAYLAARYHIDHILCSGSHTGDEKGQDNRLSLGYIDYLEVIRILRLTYTPCTVVYVPTWQEQRFGRTLTHHAVDTSGEILAARSYVHHMDRKNGALPYIISVASDTHVPSIQQLYARWPQEGNMALGAESVLQETQEPFNHIFSQVTDQIFDSPDEQGFLKQEKLKKVFYSLPFGIGVAALRFRASLKRELSSWHQTEESTQLTQ